MDSHSTKPNKDARSESFTHDKFFATMMADEVTARLFFQFFLPQEVLEQLDLATLRPTQTRNVDAKGRDSEGDLFFVVDYKNRRGKKRKRAVFMIILEHKSRNERYISIQLLKYVLAALERMSRNPSEYEDESGRLPAPYAILFSQEPGACSKILNLEDLVYTAKGCESSVPIFRFQTIDATAIPLDKLRQSDLIMRAFLYLSRVARREYESGEREELKEIFKGFVEAKTYDERLRQAMIASINYWIYLKKSRQQMPTPQDIREEIETEEGRTMENPIFEIFADAIERRCSKVRDESFEQGVEQGVERGRMGSIYDVIFRNLGIKYKGRRISKGLRAKIDAVNSYPALEEIQVAVLTSDSLAAFERSVDEIVSKYAER